MVPIPSSLPFHQWKATLHGSPWHLRQGLWGRLHGVVHRGPELPPEAVQILAVLLHVVKAGNFAQTSWEEDEEVRNGIFLVCIMIYIHIYIYMYIHIYMYIYIYVYTWDFGRRSAGFLFQLSKHVLVYNNQSMVRFHPRGTYENR